jgi:hypothetical protein
VRGAPHCTAEVAHQVKIVVGERGELREREGIARRVQWSRLRANVDVGHKGVEGTKRFAFVASKRLHTGGNRYSVLQSGAVASEAGVETGGNGDEGRGAG